MFVAGSIGLVVASVAAFILYPTLILASALQDNEGAWRRACSSPSSPTRASGASACVSGDVRCGVAWNSLLLAC